MRAECTCLCGGGVPRGPAAGAWDAGRVEFPLARPLLIAAGASEFGGFAGDHGWPPQLLALLAGVPLPAKANLRLRWARGADREAAYVSVQNPLGGQLTGRRPTW